MLTKIITIACVLGSAAFFLQAAFAPFYMVGADRISVALVFVGFAALFLFFLRRKRWTWLFMLAFTFIQPIISISNFPSEKYYGNFTFATRVLVIIQALVCIVIFVAMLMPATKRWFTGVEPIIDTSKDRFHHGEVLEVTYQEHFWDMVRFNIYQIPRSRSAQITFALIMFAACLPTLGVLSSTQYSFVAKVLTYITILMSILLGLIMLNLFIFGIIYFVRQFDIRAKMDRKFSVSESGVIYETPFKCKAIGWSEIEKVEQNSNYIMYYLSDWAAFVIPKRAFADRSGAEKFFVYSRHCLEKANKVTSTA